MSREKLTRKKGHVRSTCWKLRVMPGYQFHKCLVGKAFPRNTRETFFLEDFKCNFLTLHLYHIYPHYPQKYAGGHTEKKTLDKFSTTHTHPSFRERVTHP